MLPLLLFFFFFKRNRRTDIRVILFYCGYAFLNDNTITKLYASEKNDYLILILLSLFTVIEYLLFSAFVYLNLPKGLLRKLILIVSPCFLAYTFFEFVRTQDSSIDSPAITIENILLIIFCMFYFFKEISQPKSVFIYSSYAFWVIVSILIYSTGTFFYFAYSDNLSDDEWRKWSIINHIFTVIKNILFGIAVFMPKKVNNTLQSQEKQYPDQLFDPPPLNPL
ncbi:MAG TPA: hypothetical protein VM488_15260 [Pseudobacter sp.]|nr:hypothetical protein [Pseudobacter sp.]